MTALPPLPLEPPPWAPTKNERLDAELRRLDRWLARELDEPWRLKAPWFEGISNPERPPLDHWVRL